ncbi:MAG: outer membrane protein assembly factor BamD [Candidatus Hydrogenedentes bacterium]|nr:outer membrane protein assembly factor BamD [Candidatus Hydrogenedentota bacterium]
MRQRIGRLVVLAAAVVLMPWAAYAQWTWTPQTGRFVNVKKLPKETAELQIEHARGFLIKGELKRAWNETDKFYEFFRKDPLADQNQFLRGEIRMAEEKWVPAAKEFQQVISKYPGTSLYDKAIAKQYEIGDKLYAQGEAKMKKSFLHRFKKRPFKKAIEVYSMVIHNQPFTDAAAEAQYKVGLCHQTRKDYTEATFEYKRVIEDYSSSDWVDKACYGLATCYCASARRAEYDQGPSKLAVEAIDDFKRRYPGDERIKDLDEKRSVMRGRIASQHVQTAQYYEKRRNFEAARIYYELVTRDFADTPLAEKAQRWLTKNPTPEPSPAERVLRAKQKAAS